MCIRDRFPGPGLGVRCLGAITRDRLEALRESDAILREEFAKTGLDKKVWQYFTVVPDFKAVGVRDNARSMGYMVVIRAVNTIDAMTASIERIDYDILERICARITAEVPSVSRVCYETVSYTHLDVYKRQDIAFEFASWISPEFKLYICLLYTSYVHGNLWMVF